MDNWHTMLLLERIRELQEAEVKFSVRANQLKVPTSHDIDYPAAELRNDAISAYEAEEWQRCQQLCEWAEQESVDARSQLELRYGRGT
jgi:hypothetical protein